MHTTIVTLTELKLVGISTRTNNTEIFESDPATHKIAATIHTYVHNGYAEKIKNRKNPGTTFCVYTRYESDMHGDYTYFIGEEVAYFEEIDTACERLTIPAQHYAKFTNQPGPMPTVCIDMWHNIWNMTAADLGGERAYIADFEVYDERSKDPHNAILDIYIGIQT